MPTRRSDLNWPIPSKIGRLHQHCCVVSWGTIFSKMYSITISSFQNRATLPVKRLLHADGHMWDLQLLHKWFIPAHDSPSSYKFAGQMCAVGVPQ